MIDLEKQHQLLEMDESAIQRLYLRVFDNHDGKLVLEDLRNRCYFYVSTAGDPLKEGMRCTVLHIETQLQIPTTEQRETK